MLVWKGLCSLTSISQLMLTGQVKNGGRSVGGLGKLMIRGKLRHIYRVYRNVQQMIDWVIRLHESEFVTSSVYVLEHTLKN